MKPQVAGRERKDHRVRVLSQYMIRGLEHNASRGCESEAFSVSKAGIDELFVTDLRRKDD